MGRRTRGDTSLIRRRWRQGGDVETEGGCRSRPTTAETIHGGRCTAAITHPEEVGSSGKQSLRRRFFSWWGLKWIFNEKVDHVVVCVSMIKLTG